VPSDAAQVAETEYWGNSQLAREFEKALAYAERIQNEYELARSRRLNLIVGGSVFLLVLLVLFLLTLRASEIRPQIGFFVQSAISAVAVGFSSFEILWIVQTNKEAKKRRISLEKFVHMLHEIESQYLKEASAIEQALLKIRLARLEL
jgi:hypothetical protein